MKSVQLDLNHLQRKGYYLIQLPHNLTTLTFTLSTAK